MTGFGGAIKNIGMGCGSRAGKKDQHNNGKPEIDPEKCRGCLRCRRECANDALEFSERTRKMRVNPDKCVGCGRCLGACNFDAIGFSEDSALSELNARMADTPRRCGGPAEFPHLAGGGRIAQLRLPRGKNDAPNFAQLGMFASFDPLALDQACADALPEGGAHAGEPALRHLARPGFHDHHDHFVNAAPDSEWRTCLAHAEKIGLGTRAYELIPMK
jgi:uncharacterized Fe-S center protein